MRFVENLYLIVTMFASSSAETALKEELEQKKHLLTNVRLVLRWSQKYSNVESIQLSLSVQRVSGHVQ